MVKKFFTSIVVTAATLSFHANAAVIQYEQLSQSANRYEYSYQVTNDTIGDGIEEFSIYFDYSLYDNIEITASPTDWDPLVLQVDQLLLEDGVADWLTFTDPLALGETLIGFNVAFDFVGTDISQLLQAQPFEIFDANFDIIESGFTSVSAVPEPDSFVLFSLGIAFYSWFASRSRKNKARL